MTRLPAHRAFDRALFPTALLLTAPSWVVLGALALFGYLPLWITGIAGGAVLISILMVVRVGLRGMAAAASTFDDASDAARAAPAFPPAAALQSQARAARRRIEEEKAALKEELATVRGLFAAAPVAILLLDDDRNITLANDAAESLLGRSPATGPLLSLLRGPAVWEAINDALAKGEDASAEFDVAATTPRTLSAIIRPVDRDLGHERVAALMVIEDRTATKRMDQVRADFVANASHELRTPLSTLTGYIETLLGKAGGDERARVRFLEIMASQASRMARLLDDLMSLSQLETDEAQPPQGVVDLLQVVRDQIDAQQIAAAEHGISFEIDAGTGDSPSPVLAAGDPDQVTQVVQNLIDNAIKYSRRDTLVKIVLAPKGPEKVTLSVLDRGEGIAPEHLDRLTERFYRVDMGRSRQMGGTGLGLAIVKHIVSRHGGELDIESALGEGSRFTVTLPAAPTGGLSTDPTVQTH